MKRKFLFISKDYLTPSIPYKMQKDLGHECIYFIAPEDDKGEKHELSRSYEGMNLKITNNPDEVKEQLTSKDWIKVCEDTLLTDWVKDAIRDGHGVINGYKQIEKWETDREYGQKIAEKVAEYNEGRGLPLNIVVPERKEFSDFEEAIEFLQENEGPYVIKESGESGNRQVNYKGELKSNMDSIIRLQHLASHGGVGGEEKFTLQKRIFGIEVGTTIFFNGKNALNYTENDFEHQCLLDHERGPNTGEFFNEAICLERDKNILYKIVFEPLIPALRKAGFHGFINLNMIINKDGCFPLEWTVRASGTPWVTQIYEELQDKYDYGEFLADLAFGKDSKISWKEGFTLGARIDTPPTIFEGVSLKYFTKELEDKPELMDYFKRMVQRGDTEIIKKFLEKYTTFNENAGSMPLIIEGFTDEIEKHAHFTDAYNLQTFEIEGKRYAVFYASAFTPIYFTANASSPKIAAMKIDNFIDSLSGLRFLTRSDYGEKVLENLEKLESYGITMFPEDNNAVYPTVISS